MPAEEREGQAAGAPVYPPFPEAYKGCVLVPGNFDGVHRGHMHMLREAGALGEALNAPVVALTFEPHPVSYFAGDAARPFRLTDAEMKTALLRENGADYVDILPFTPVLAGTEAGAFIENCLIRRCGASAVVSGYDFVFGKGRDGNRDLLRRYADDGAFILKAPEPFLTAEGYAVSSSRIRGALHEGDIALAAALLGRDPSLSGTVIRGDGVAGKALGYPTANLDTGAHIRPRYGVYAALAVIEGEAQERACAVNIGIRPTLCGKRECVEAHMIEAALPPFYGKEVILRLLAFIRPEKSFAGAEELKKQIAEDIKAVKVCVAARAGSNSAL